MRDDGIRVDGSLDPEDWGEAARVAHRMVDDAIEHLKGIRARPVWRPLPDSTRAALATPVPREPSSLSGVYDDFLAQVRPWPMGNIHPRFFGWFMGSGNLTGALADFLAAIDGSNLGGGMTAPAQVDRQVTAWLKELVGFPADAGATLTGGGSVANLVCLTVARNVMAGVDVREHGVCGLEKPMRFYASAEVHSCVQKALEVLGLGNSALVRIPVDGAFRMDVAALTRAIAEDRARGMKPACVIATAGTVNSGAVDPIADIAEVARREGMWFHVDGCIGALVRLAPQNRHRVAGIEAADSLSLDPHKWLHAPFEAGCAIVRDRRAHFGAFTLHGEYLEEKPRGPASGEYLFDYGVDLSRGFKALKIWMAMKHHGAEKFGRLIDQNIALAQYLAGRVEATPGMELVAPVSLNIVCFRLVEPGMDEDALAAFNAEVHLRVQEGGVAVPTDTRLNGRYCLRVAVVSHRTTRKDMDIFLTEVQRVAADVRAG
jgi:glutamate/tyrosine decarboxylase-like PLP-dependent enzyme